MILQESIQGRCIEQSDETNTSNRTSLNAVSVFNPIGFDPSIALPVHLHKYRDHARYFVHLVVYAPIFNRRLIGQLVPLKAEYLRGYFPGQHVYAKVRAALLDGGWLLCDRQYVVGKKAMGYRLSDELRATRIRRVLLSDLRLIGKIRTNRADWIRTPQAVHRHLLHWLERTEIDYQAALSWLLDQDKFEPTDEIAAQLIRDRQFRLWPCDYGRIHSNLTNLKSGLRRFLSFDGEPLVNLDIRNSQPLFLAIVLRQRFGSTSLPEDVQRYLDLVQAGQFYDHLMDVGGLTGKSRVKFKQRFFATVLFCENDPISDDARLFARSFPNVYEVIRLEKQTKHEALAWELQRAESQLMIGRVCVRIMHELPLAYVATIHDSILCTQDAAEAFREILLEEFAEIGLRPSIQIKSPECN